MKVVNLLLRQSLPCYMTLSLLPLPQWPVASPTVRLGALPCIALEVVSKH
jgi:hypothetical protein